MLIGHYHIFAQSKESVTKKQGLENAVNWKLLNKGNNETSGTKV